MSKILTVEETKLYYVDTFLSFTNVYITKHSENIIDLIEVGDYVNGELISNVDKVDNMNIIEWSNGDIYKTDIQNDKFIKSIVTHEQFNSIKYEVE